ncbi:MAG: hypothetical protein KF870_14345 [Leadbetterella sp.]|nr:hypothetical protein [Leadbetterella sp.]
MKKPAIVFVLTLFVSSTFGQKASNEREKTVKLADILRPGISISAFYNPKGEYVYLLNQDSSLEPTAENKSGATASLVWLIPFNNKGTGNVMISIPIFDLKSNVSDTKVSSGLFNTQTPFGLGIAFFPFSKLPAIGFSGGMHYLNQNKMRDKPLKENYFPIADYKTFDLKVGAPVPEAVLKPFLKHESYVSFNVGMVFRLVYSDYSK